MVVDSLLLLLLELWVIYRRADIVSSLSSVVGRAASYKKSPTNLPEISTGEVVVVHPIRERLQGGVGITHGPLGR